MSILNFYSLEWTFFVQIRLVLKIILYFCLHNKGTNLAKGGSTLQSHFLLQLAFVNNNTYT